MTEIAMAAGGETFKLMPDLLAKMSQNGQTPPAAVATVLMLLMGYVSWGT
jgi:hypothetical protein